MWLVGIEPRTCGRAAESSAESSLWPPKWNFQLSEQRSWENEWSETEACGILGDLFASTTALETCICLSAYTQPDVQHHAAFGGLCESPNPFEQMA